MIFARLSREQLLTLLPKGGTIAEIGTAAGDFAAEILSKVGPETLHLIDPWVHQVRDDYQHDPINAPQIEQDTRFAAITKRFETEIATGQVVMHRAFSPAAADLFEDGTFDWVYIDGLHAQAAVAADLRAWDPKVKADGLILGHDYANHPKAISMGFGVVEAVNDYVKETGSMFVALTCDDYPTYALSKTQDSPAASTIISNIIYSVPGCINIRNPEDRGFRQDILRFPDGVLRILPTI